MFNIEITVNIVQLKRDQKGKEHFSSGALRFTYICDKDKDRKNYPATYTKIK